MEKDQEQKHACKFCSKSFPCGRSLGGHMRSHFITISSQSDHRKKAPKKKKTSKIAEGDDNTTQKSCKECGKPFQSWKALFGHMKCHVNAKNCLDGDSWIMDSQSDNEAATPSCRKKRSDRMMKRCNGTTASSSLTVTNSVSEMDQHEQEEVALSLIILSRDKGEWADNSPQLSEAEETDHCPKKMRKSKCMIQLEANNETERNKSKFTCSICKKAFNSYQALGGHRASHKKFKGCCAPENSLETENSNNQSEDEKKSRDHECPICYKVFPSGQALGGHKRSHLINAPAETEKPARGIRGFLDLNLPAPVEEECSEFKPWWVGPGPVLGLLSS